MGHPAPGLFGGGRFGPEAGVEAFDDTVDDEGEAGGELGRVGDLFGGDGVGQVEAGTDDGEGGVFFLRAGLGAVKGFDVLEERGKKRKGAEEELEEVRGKGKYGDSDSASQNDDLSGCARMTTG
jgi:hypothetical protein